MADDSNERGPDGVRRLQVYEKSMALVEAVYRITDGFPQREQFALT